MKRCFLLLLTAVFLLIIHFPEGALCGQVDLVINYPSISPNGDGVKDSFSASLFLSGEVDTLIVTIEDTARTQVFAELLFLAPATGAEYSAPWDGTDLAGSPLPEGEYILRLYESTGGVAEEQTRTVVIDLTAPSIAIDRIEPGVFSPGYPDPSAAVTVYYIITGYEEGCDLYGTITSPAGVSETVVLEATGDGQFSFDWNPGSTASSGMYEVEVDIVDEAGNGTSGSGIVIVDTDGPVIEFFTMIEDQVREVPPSITGYCYDAGGVAEDSLKVAWGQKDAEGVYSETDFFSPDSTWWIADSLYWRFDLPDTVNGTVSYFENSYTLKVKCYDNYGQSESVSMTFELDRTPPPVPVLNAPSEVVIETPYDLDIEFDDTETDSIFIYRLYEGIPTVYGKKYYQTMRVDLEEGVNEIWAEAKDLAGNRSESSDVITVIFQISASINYPEAFRGPGIFQIITDDTALGVVIDIFDLAGGKVRNLTYWGSSTTYSLEWDLLNDDGETVRNGPYLMIMTIHYDSHQAVEKSFIAVVK